MRLVPLTSLGANTSNQAMANTHCDVIRIHLPGDPELDNAGNLSPPPATIPEVSDQPPPIEQQDVQDTNPLADSSTDNPLPLPLVSEAETNVNESTRDSEPHETPTDSDDSASDLYLAGEPKGPTGLTEPDPEERTQEFLIPVHGFVYLSDREVQIIEHPAFQRLFNINQLGQTNLVYRGATHRRGEHALGAMAAVDLLIEAIDRSCRKDAVNSSRCKLGPTLSEIEIVYARLSVLLHDIGHIAAGHTLEDELGILGKHDSKSRLNFVLDKDCWGGRSISDPDCPIDETLRTRIDQLFKQEADLLQSSNGASVPITASEVLTEIIAKDPDKEFELECQIKDVPFRLNILRDLVGNTVCADLLDYLHRDWYHIGKVRSLDTRLLHYMEIRTEEDSPEGLPEGEGKSEIVVNLQSNKVGRYRSDAVSAILDLLESRYQLWEIALLHRTKTGAVAMLERAISELLDVLNFYNSSESIHDRVKVLQEELLETIFEATDSELYTLLSTNDWLRNIEEYSDAEVPDLTQQLLWRLRYRVLHKQIARVDYGSYTSEVAGRLAPSQPGDRRPEEAAADRLASLRILEDDFCLERGSLVVYCASLRQGEKLARVRVLHDDGIRPLNVADSDETITGGHLVAQEKRFMRLWRASLYVSPEAFESLEHDDLFRALQSAFRVGLLGIRDTDIQMQDIAKILTTSKRHIEQYAVPDQLRDSPRLAAEGDPTDLAYPSGAPTLRAFFGD